MGFWSTENFIKEMDYYRRAFKELEPLVNVSGLYETVEKHRKVQGDISNADIVIVYGDIKGNVNNANDVIIINGDVKGDVINCSNIAGLLSDKAVRVGTSINILH